jgi:hypothetical protein
MDPLRMKKTPEGQHLAAVAALSLEALRRAGAGLRRGCLRRATAVTGCDAC